MISQGLTAHSPSQGGFASAPCDDPSLHYQVGIFRLDRRAPGQAAPGRAAGPRHDTPAPILASSSNPIAAF